MRGVLGPQERVGGHERSSEGTTKGEPERGRGREYTPNCTFFFPCNLLLGLPTGHAQPRGHKQETVKAVHAGQPPEVERRMENGEWV